jgi:NAD(P)-dependent dehydrogenase (short-subunit alcohol dehydrogenase family)
VRLTSKTAIITGAGAGIGEAIAMRFSEEGARVVLNDINPAAVEAVARKLAGPSVIAVGDVSNDDDAQAISQAAIAKFGAIDILVNNAADFTQMSVEAATVADWERVLRVNVIGTALVAKYAIPDMKKRRSGSIVNVASMSGLIAQPEFATYNASKGAVITMTKCMALDLAPFQIRVNTICPGCVVTTASYREVARMGITFDEWERRVAPLHMLNRLGEASEVANAALFLASDEASFITSATLMVDGGYTGR